MEHLFILILGKLRFNLKKKQHNKYFNFVLIYKQKT